MAFGVFGHKANDALARQYPGNGTADVAAALADVAPNGVVTTFPSSASWTPPSVPPGVLLVVFNNGRQTLYDSNGIVTASGRVKRIRDFGGVGNGAVDETAAIMAAYAALPASGGYLDFEDGIWRHDFQLLFDTKRVKLLGMGSGVVYDVPPACKIINNCTSTFGMIFLQDRSGIEGIAYIGATDAGGVPIRTTHGVQFLNNSCSMKDTMIAKMSQDGCWLGDNSATSGTYNLNFWYLEHVHFSRNGRDGLFLSCRDNAGGGNANAGQANRVSSVLNGRNGVRIRDAGKNVWNALCTEENVAEGLYLLGMAHNNVFIGGDQEGNFKVPPTTGSPTVQVKISNEEGSGHTPIDCRFYEVGINFGTTIVDQGIHTKIESSDYPFPLPNNLLGEIASNATAASKALGTPGPAIPTSPAGSGIYQSIYDQTGERLRFGVTHDAAGLQSNILAAQIMAMTNSVLNIVARSNNDNGRVQLLAGQTLSYYAYLQSTWFETNRSINVAGGATGYHVGGTRVVTSRQAAITDALTAGSATAANCATTINLVLAALRAHGLIA